VTPEAPETFELRYTPTAEKTLRSLKDDKNQVRRYKKAVKALKNLRTEGPSYPALHSHLLITITFNGSPVWQSYIENKTPGAWRMTWVYGPHDGVITLTSFHAHPD